MVQLNKLIVAGDRPSSPLNAARTAVAAVVSYLVARLFRLPEAYWASIATLIVMQSTLGASLPISVERFVGTGIGVTVGAVAAAYFGGSPWAFGMAVFLTGMLCAALHVGRGAYRYASITLAIIMLIPRSDHVWLIAIHRFFEISLGIAVGLLLSAVWPERPGKGTKISGGAPLTEPRTLGS
jgi:uncharacterized membrane protein YgaE (UPF0421/DUF939 family)